MKYALHLGSTAIEVFNQLVSSQYDCIAVIGYAAATKAYKHGDIVFPSYAQYSDANVPEGLGFTHLTKQYDLIGEDCPIYTSDSFVDKSFSASIRKKFKENSCLFDMESAAICQVADDFNVPVLVIKMVSDIPEIDDDTAFSKFVSENTDFSSMVCYLNNM